MLIIIFLYKKFSPIIWHKLTSNYILKDTIRKQYKIIYEDMIFFSDFRDNKIIVILCIIMQILLFNYLVNVNM